VATQAQLAQYALNVSLALQNEIINGQTEPGTKGGIVALSGAVAMLAEAILNAGGPTTIPGSLTTGKWSYNQSTTAPINF
jgi:hypothetical protein